MYCSPHSDFKRLADKNSAIRAALGLHKQLTPDLVIFNRPSEPVPKNLGRYSRLMGDRSSLPADKLAQLTAKGAHLLVLWPEPPPIPAAPTSAGQPSGFSSASGGGGAASASASGGAAVPSPSSIGDPHWRPCTVIKADAAADSFLVKYSDLNIVEQLPLLEASPAWVQLDAASTPSIITHASGAIYIDKTSQTGKIPSKERVIRDESVSSLNWGKYSWERQTVAQRLLSNKGPVLRDSLRKAVQDLLDKISKYKEAAVAEGETDWVPRWEAEYAAIAGDNPARFPNTHLMQFQ